MREVLFAAICLLALPMSAYAGEVNCNGRLYGMQTRNVITMESEMSPKCEISIKASRDIRKWCNPDSFCTFRGRVVGQRGNIYVIDKIVGGVDRN